MELFDDNSMLGEDNADIELDTQKDKYLTFNIANEDYGIEISFIREIVGIQEITSLPELPVFLKGVINLRGVIIPVIDVRLRFGMEEIDYEERTCIIVVQIREVSFGLIVDSVSEVLSIEENLIDSPPGVRKDSKDYFLKGIAKVGDEVKIIVDIDRILSSKEIEIVNSVN
jgi:purine-binding chemotaxis protein CheW